MRLLIEAVGRLRAKHERALYEDYETRIAQIGRSVGLAPLATLEVKESVGRSAVARRNQEAEALIAKLPAEGIVWALDETGEVLTSARFAADIAALRDNGAPALTFLIGGADGLSDAARVRSDRIVSLSALTLPHGIARIVLAEQLYRAATMLAGHPYHRA